MIVYAIDDEEAALELLALSLRQAMPDDEIKTFDDPEDALQEAKKDIPDIVFTDIQMPGMTGMELARRMKTINHRLNIIFVTAYSDFSMEAVSVHASGYVMKPISGRKVKKELENLLYDIDFTQQGFYARTFGTFNFLKDGKAISFKREKSRELMALLIDQGCASLSNEQIASYLYEDQPYDNKVKNVITTIISELKASLKAVDAEDLIIKTWGHIQLDKTKFKCDAYDYWNGKPYAINAFRGEYMTDYSWAEESLAKFYWDDRS